MISGSSVVKLRVVRGVHLLMVALLAVVPSGVLAATDPVALNDRIQLADGLFRRGHFDMAAKEYAHLSKESGVPGLDSILFRLGESLRRTGKSNEAQAAYKRLIDECAESPQVPRAHLQRALSLMAAGEESLPAALESFEALTAPSTAPEVRSAALYHSGQALEKLKRPMEALKHYETLTDEYGSSDYSSYAGLRVGFLLTHSGKPEEMRRALGIFLDLAHKAKEQKVVEDAYFFAAQIATRTERYEESANLFATLREKFPQSSHVGASALMAGWANYYAGRYKEALAWVAAVPTQAPAATKEEQLYLRANVLRYLERRKEAVESYAELIKSFPESKFLPRARFERIATLYSDGNYAATLAAAEEVGQVAPEFVDNVYWMSAEAAITLDKQSEAVQNYRALVDKCPESPFVKGALYRLGWLLQRQEVWESAASWYQQVAERFPQDELASKAIYAAGECRSRLGQRDAALRDWTTLLTKYPDSPEVPEALYRKAMDELRLKNARAAAATLDERIRRFPDEPRKAEVLYWRASIAHQLGDKSEAEKFYRASLASAPTKEFERMATLELGVLVQEMDRKDEAAELFQTLLDAPVIDKVGADRLAWLAKFQFAQKRPDAAAKAANALLALQPDKGWQQTAWTLLGRIHQEKGERDPAIDAYQKALDSGASTEHGAEAALRLGELLTAGGRFDEAEERLTDASLRAATPELVSVRSRAYVALAKNFELKGDPEKAVRYYITVATLFEDKTLVPQALARAVELLEQLGRTQEAGEFKKELQERYPRRATK